ncbi:aldo/keto reductase [Cyanobium gracile UHCC 0139]|uniref:Aldo/keto reductase n=1 Tax=Cyanobium gracile UHCC 0139 TaxID=3110308 RepID=A0ABU5RVU6_9CYAN|nr:aldo/keto reductase [Cyanobium gracile]MEA5391900.1 aldo/keto reductase [Cyanobium gracile UHCC 0139]
MADPAAILPDPPPSVVPGVGVGTWAWGNQFLWGYDPAQDDTLAACFHRAVDLGLTFFDTADSYGTGRYGGRSESLLGDFVAALPPARRQRLTVATKLAPFPWRLGRRGFDAAFEASLGRLRGHLDRVQLHWSTARYAPWQEGPLLEGLADLVAEGRVGSLGISNLGPRRLRRVHDQLARRGLRLASLQVQLSLLAPDAIGAHGVASVCRELGIELLAYSPLALGLLAQPPGESRAALPAGPRGLLFRRLGPRIQPLLQTMERIARAHEAPMAAVAINWCRAHGALPLVGMRRPDQAEAAAAAAAWCLAEEERQDLDRVALRGEARMPANPFQSA